MNALKLASTSTAQIECFLSFFHGGRAFKRGEGDRRKFASIALIPEKPSEIREKRKKTNGKLANHCKFALAAPLGLEALKGTAPWAPCQGAKALVRPFRSL